jgi:hypothetical protein
LIDFSHNINLIHRAILVMNLMNILHKSTLKMNRKNTIFENLDIGHRIIINFTFSKLTFPRHLKATKDRPKCCFKHQQIDQTRKKPKKQKKKLKPCHYHLLINPHKIQTNKSHQLSKPLDEYNIIILMSVDQFKIIFDL